MSASLEKCFEGVSGMFAEHECAPVRSLARPRGAYPRVHQVEGDSLFLPKNGCGDVPPRGGWIFAGDDLLHFQKLSQRIGDGIDGLSSGESAG